MEIGLNKNACYEVNIRLFSAYRFFIRMLIIGPVLTPYMLSKGLSYSQIMLLQSLSAISVVAFEVPTGAVADKVSRRLSLALSGVFIGIGLLLYILFESFHVFALAEILFGLGMTFSSGADSAILYESLAKLERTGDYQKITGRAASYVFIGQGIGSVISSLLYKLNPDIPFWASVASALIAALVAIGFVETKRQKSEHGYQTHILRSLSISLKTPHILWAVLFACIMGFAFRTAYWLYEPYFKRVHIDVAWFGAIFFCYNMIAAASAKYLLDRLSSRNPRTVLLSLGILLAVSYLLPVLFVFPWAIALIGLQQIVRGLYRPTMEFYINRQIKDEYRATVISIVSLAASLCFAVLSPLVGISLDRQGAIPTYTWMGAVTLGSVLLLTLMRKIQKTRQNTEPAF